MTAPDPRLEAIKSALDELGGAFTDKFHALAAALRAVHDPSEDASAPTASPVDPPWLGEAAIAGMSAYNRAADNDRELAYCRAVLAFAAAQPRGVK
jgi:hypothetical protein